MASLEHDIVTFFKQWLHDYMQSYVSNTRHYVVVGASALEMQVQDPVLVNTLDVDMHIWDDYIFNENEQHKMVEKLAVGIESYFRNEIYPRNKGICDTFINLTHNQFDKTTFTNSKWLKGAWDNYRVYTWNVKVFGYDLTDIVYQTHSSNEYFTVKAHNKKISYLTPKAFMNAQFKVFIEAGLDKLFHFKNIYYEAQYIKNKKAFWREFAEKGYNYGSPSEYGSFEILHKGNKDFRVIRINKTLKRLNILFNTFNVSDNMAIFSFKQSKTSCLMLSFSDSDDVWVTRDEKNKCNIRTLFGGNEINYNYLENFVYHKPINMFQYIRELDQTLLAKNIYTNLLSVSKSWSEQSSPITQFLRTKYYHKLLNINTTSHAESAMIRYIYNLQTLCSIRGPEFPVIAFKTARMLYIKSKGENRFKSSFDVGDEIPLYEFHSTSVNPNFKNYMQFANFEIRCAGFIIKIPANSRVFYMGTDKLRTLYPYEYEMLLPYGCSLKITQKHANYYVGGENDIKYRMDIYEAIYIDPPEIFFQQNMIHHELGHNIAMLSSDIIAPNVLTSEIPTSNTEFSANIISAAWIYVKNINYKKMSYKLISKLLYGLGFSLISVLSTIGWSIPYIMDTIKWIFGKIGVIVSKVYGYHGVVIEWIKTMALTAIEATIIKIKTSSIMNVD